MTSNTLQLDPSAPEFLQDPYPTLAALRETGPVLWHEPMGMWLATTHDSVSQVLRNRAFGRIWTDWEPTAEMEPFNALHRNQMMENEPPTHTRLRRLVAAAFGRGHVERMRPRIESLAAQMVDELGDSFDLLGDYAEPMPVYVIADMLGVPREDHARLRDWSQAIVHMYEPGVGAPTKAAAIEASTAFSDYVRDVVEQRRSSPGEDLITDLIQARDDGSKLSDDELVASVVLLLNAGHEASVNVFGNGFHALLEHPDQLARITSGEVPVETALEELIRYDAALQLFERTATADVEVSGQLIRTGEKIACLMGSANRDAAVFADADTFDVGRDPNPHVGFGMGLHFCLGAPLARLELQISIKTLLGRFPSLELAGEAPRRPTWVLRGYEKIDVKAAP
ncbi:cytochrome P450 [Aeromicrobium wangtongii]|uniref:Cytochrome P450 n=1 Tax=Aeromicrobium wangtongii TaxID=2969247 RepID=A0ABY5M4D7_9ACTN|nr:cytochrome P450 [Aeromicrobium wangtongii]MCD9198922.1 cytochrome P450 [Aeromicrobium wangtongii]UUP13040.1 cytochrome P450 [Aeromicrobium wangtongii]